MNTNKRREKIIKEDISKKMLDKKTKIEVPKFNIIKSNNGYIALIYTIVIGYIYIDSLIDNNFNIAIICCLLFPPVIMNWLSYINWKE